MTATPIPNRMTAVALALAASACLIYAALTRQWLVNNNPVEERAIGLRSSSSCIVGTGSAGCSELTNKELIEEFHQDTETTAQQTSGAFVPMGLATFIECFVGALGLLAAAAFALAKKTPDLPMAPTTVGLLAIMALLITGMVFIATKPGPPGYVGVGLSFWVFAGGAVMGIVANQMLAKINRPVDPDLLADSMDPDQY
ncbi:MAG: hypothetical protein JWO36_1108 [Myxococcales bacterium]|nr:hypothetical protein [Myxococcales bacterium]